MRTAALLTVALACGGAPRKTGPATAPPPPPPTAPQAPANNCQLALVALADGRLDGWNGTDGCTRADVEHVFGTTGQPDIAGGLGLRQQYAAQRAAPFAINVDYAGDRDTIIDIEIPSPELSAAQRTGLGPPEATAPSHHFEGAVQEVWASRGLTIHVEGDEIIGVVAYPRTTADAFLSSELVLAFEMIEDPIR
jgi:hypothetical protein